MLGLNRRQMLIGATGLAAGAFAATQEASAAPLTIRLGYSQAAEEQLWLLMAKPDLAKNYGKLYTLNGTRFTSSSVRAQAFAANAIDIASGGADGVLFAAAEGVETKIIASLAREGLHHGFDTSFLALQSAKINSLKDLKGKTVGINGFSTNGELWLRSALERHGMSEHDVTVVPISFPAMAESLKSGRIDVGEFPQPFYALAHHEMKVKTVFTSKDGVPFDEELIVLISHGPFLKAHGAAVRGFLADLQAATTFYLQHTKEARRILVEKRFVRVPLDIYLNLRDYYRPPHMRVNIESLKKMQDIQVSAGFQKKKADIEKVVDMNYLPK